MFFAGGPAKARKSRRNIAGGPFVRKLRKSRTEVAETLGRGAILTYFAGYVDANRD